MSEIELEWNLLEPGIADVSQGCGIDSLSEDWSKSGGGAWAGPDEGEMEVGGEWGRVIGVTVVWGSTVFWAIGGPLLPSMGRVVEDWSGASNIGAGTWARAETGIAEAGKHGGAEIEAGGAVWIDRVDSTGAHGTKPEGARVVWVGIAGATSTGVIWDATEVIWDGVRVGWELRSGVGSTRVGTGTACDKGWVDFGAGVDCIMAGVVPETAPATEMDFDFEVDTGANWLLYGLRAGIVLGGIGVFLIASGADWLGAGTLADSDWDEDGAVLGSDETITAGAGEGEAGVGFSCTLSFIAEGFCRGSSETFI